MSISKKIRLLRFNNNDTPAKDLAVALGISKETIYNYESGKVKPSMERLKEIANFFNVDVSYFNEDLDILQNEKNITQNKIQKERDISFEQKLMQVGYFVMGKFGIKKEEWREVEELFLAKIKMYPYIRFVA